MVLVVELDGLLKDRDMLLIFVMLVSVLKERSLWLPLSSLKVIDATDSEECTDDTSDSVPISPSEGIVDFHPQTGVMMHVAHIHDGL